MDWFEQVSSERDDSNDKENENNIKKEMGVLEFRLPLQSDNVYETEEGFILRNRNIGVFIKWNSKASKPKWDDNIDKNKYTSLFKKEILHDIYSGRDAIIDISGIRGYYRVTDKGIRLFEISDTGEHILLAVGWDRKFRPILEDSIRDESKVLFKQNHKDRRDNHSFVVTICK